MMEYGMRIKELRKARGWSAEQLAEKTGISPATIYRYENGTTEEPKSSMLRRIAEALNVDVWQIIQFDNIEMDDRLSTIDKSANQVREDLFNDPDRRALLSFARNGSPEAVRQVNALIDALKSTNPDFYDGDDPA